MPLIISLGLYHKEDFYSLNLSVETTNRNVQYAISIEDIELESLLIDHNLIKAIEETIAGEHFSMEDKSEFERKLLNAIQEYVGKELGNYRNEN